MEKEVSFAKGQMKMMEESMMVFPKVERGVQSWKASGIASGLVAMIEASEKVEKEEERDKPKGEETKSERPPSTNDHPSILHSPSTHATQPDPSQRAHRRAVERR
ncbi:hypothetical protein BLNAU_13919 [Blattamonas nauphoetae]|uniref:Uncharacterized protein n=1 Tax=Blattamonas nauphoetae TaxID=2049346 RepID=A0ABQ9XGR2_9EUKA|nr:hypothetical protein BLNAU_13919 [Blattamonas nauphoetae]